MLNTLPHGLWTGSDVITIIKGEGPAHWNATGISIDTRTLQPGDLFIALRGPKMNGHDFIQDAWALGACAVIVDDLGSLVTDPNYPTVVVTDTHRALTELAVAARSRFDGTVLALTGSVGKTSVKEGLAHVLSNQGLTSASRNSLNNHLGVPLSLARLPKEARFGIFEVGMNHSGEITQLVASIRPHIALITQVSYQHGEFFDTLDDIVLAKSEIFSAPAPLIGIIPRDSPHYEALLRHGQMARHVTQWITFGEHPESNIQWQSTEDGLMGQRRIHITINGTPWAYDWSLPGYHTLYNSLAIVAGAFALGADMEKVMQDMRSISACDGRGNVRIVGGIKVIDDSYNAAPASMQAALQTFLTSTEPLVHPSDGKRYVLLGQMRELGQHSYACHRDLVPFIQACKADGVWLCGQEFAPLLTEIPHFLGYAEHACDIIPHVVKTLLPGDTILIKGANSMKLSALIPALEQRMSALEQSV
ncbi:MAG: UDP-N-acetylmuramoyl-tripeptide--D-alanyl-D-alanine ligase [Alphaproteobacteria bacterium]|nr:UDP-N-acetylmuramoyl-tripeptide--D-alanyl-D-alanine ligase [Alphaproteobacteria bacterium]